MTFSGVLKYRKLVRPEVSVRLAFGEEGSCLFSLLRRAHSVERYLLQIVHLTLPSVSTEQVLVLTVCTYTWSFASEIGANLSTNTLARLLLCDRDSTKESRSHRSSLLWVTNGSECFSGYYYSQPQKEGLSTKD